MLVSVPARRSSERSGVAGYFEDFGCDGVEVVLDGEAEGEVPGGREVEGFEGRPDVGGSVAEGGDCHVSGSCAPMREGGTCGQGYAASDDRVGADGSRL